MSCVRLTFLELDTHVAADLAGEEHAEDVPLLLTPHLQLQYPAVHTWLEC